ncbi:replication initiation factor domain-containing protein [Pseudoxanthomonas sp. SE1]|uniref:replication initiation factor domain-containing protein n=1 Tax=Pseudoxanthomonas sp. SE1 TaxID=1664560 RepID=UPI00240D8A84|nr:replication initiation factor domain-containing protein [Pseudoxanthomonas sp. SE1]WFC43766.1 replication initiation factor domain-containing protein [Pseudoxanthomonas sp. SE1]
MREATFSPENAVVSGATGPGSNTGQKSKPVPQHGARVDFLTVVFSSDRLVERGLTRVSLFLPGIFGLQPSDVRAGELHAKRWQFYRSSAVLVDGNGELVGRIGTEGNGDTVCISLSGTACAYIRNWHAVRMQIEALGGRISRCDAAYDDYDGVFGTVREHEARARASLTEHGGCMLFASGGTPPKTKFLDDHQSGSGSTLYVGSKGHKQLCIYEKGKQLGVAESPWVRYEARLYGKHQEIPADILTDPMKYLRGSYEYIHMLLAGIGDGIACAVEYTKRAVEHTGAALVRWGRRQCGPFLNVLAEAFGDQFESFLRECVLREGMPSRFKRVCKASNVAAYVRETINAERVQLCQS